MADEDGDAPSGGTDAAAYMREFRRNNPDAVKRQHRMAKARQEALRRLASNHPIEFADIYAKVKQEQGL